MSPPSSAASIACGCAAALERGQLGLDVGLRAHRVQLAGDVVARAARGHVVERAGGDQLVDGAGPGLHLRGLVLGALDRQPDVAHLLADAGDRLVDPGLRLGRGVGRLDRLLRVRNASTLACSRCWARVSFSSSPCSWACWAWRSVICVVSPDLRVSASRARSSRPIASAFWAWSCSLADCCSSWLTCSSTRLRLVATSATPAAYLGQQLELALVAVVERLARVLGPVERLVGLGPEDQLMRCLRLMGMRPSLVCADRGLTSP